LQRVYNTFIPILASRGGRILIVGRRIRGKVRKRVTGPLLRDSHRSKLKERVILMGRKKLTGRRSARKEY